MAATERIDKQSLQTEIIFAFSGWLASLLGVLFGKATAENYACAKRCVIVLHLYKLLF